MSASALSLVGIRSKSTSNIPTYFFSIESDNLDVLKVALAQIRDTLEVYGYDVNHERRYHD